jgi:TM2 domain-containing membrane protein YozV
MWQPVAQPRDLGISTPMNDSYYVRMQGRSLGPYALDRLRQMTRKGQVGKMHEVSTDGASWAPASSFPEIFERPAESAAFAPAVTAAVVQHGRAKAATAVATPAPVEPQWYYAVNGSQQGPISKTQLIGLIRAGTVSAGDHVFREGSADWTLAGEEAELASALSPQFPGVGGGGLSPGIDAFCKECGAGVNRRAIMCPKCGAPVVQESLPPVGAGFEVQFPTVGTPSRRSGGEQKSKTTAALLALLVGGLGAHHFYLGNTVLGIIYILACWTFIPAIVAFVEAIVFLTMSDVAFDAKYNA